MKRTRIELIWENDSIDTTAAQTKLLDLIEAAYGDDGDVVPEQLLSLTIQTLPFAWSDMFDSREPPPVEPPQGDAQ